MELQSITQRELPGSAFILDDVAFQHLQLRAIGRALTEQRIVDQERVLRGLGCGGPDRIKHHKTGLRGEADGLLRIGAGKRGEARNAAEPATKLRRRMAFLLPAR